MTAKLNDTLQLLRAATERKGARPALLCSFGKDSIVLAHIIKENLPTPPLMTHKFPMPIIYWRLQWWQHKNEFADNLKREWDLEVWDWLPELNGIKINAGQIELVAVFSLGRNVGGLAVPAGALPPEAYPDKPYLCGLVDWIHRPRTITTELSWNTFLIGHKNTDEDFDGPVPLRADVEEMPGGAKFVFPLRDWTDEDVWNYIFDYHLPYDQKRYGAGRGAPQDKWQSSDVFHACTRCIDPRETEPFVFCPKLKQMVSNRSSSVLQIDFLPDYIKEARLRQQEALA